MVNWYLTHPILEQLQSISIPISDLDRFWSVFDRLKSLEQLDFIVDEVLESDWNKFHDVSRNSEGLWSHDKRRYHEAWSSLAGDTGDVATP
ncbi:hypothetical protein BGW39_010153 [Mortierella sp. 14UC]|nr:hypothetical protein BGW39_010153 [Mortierella sp. 14UC]